MNIEQLIARINELARKMKAEGLTEAEIEERARLRSQYIAIFRGNVKQQLDRIKFTDEEDQAPSDKNKPLH